jgi:hypothetical protein
MATHGVHAERRFPGGLSQLGWPHFWLLSGILGGLLGLVILVLFLYVSRG